MIFSHEQTVSEENAAHRKNPKDLYTQLIDGSAVATAFKTASERKGCDVAVTWTQS
jgi:hypothetical protein